MSIKFIMQWDIDTDKESEYYDFIVNKYIPKIQQMGLGDIRFWYTTYGKCEQIQASGVVRDEAQAKKILQNKEWQALHQRLVELVDNYSQKLIPATKGFQI